MKRILYMVAILSAVLATSCSKVENPSQTGAEANVTFVISTSEITTRAVGDGTSANDLYYGVYSMSTEGSAEKAELIGAISKIQTSQTINLTTTVSLSLVNGKEYSILFWAQNPGSASTIDWTNRTMSYDPKTANKETYDAFFAYVPTFKVAGSVDKNVTLKRPFAQLNIGTNDMEVAEHAGMTVKETKVVVSGDIYSTLDLVSGDVSAPVATSQTYALSSIDDLADETFPVKDNDYMSMNYLLVDADKGLVNIVMEYVGSDNVTYTRNFNSVPVQRNWRTNIHGSILTDEVNYNVTIDPEFENSYERVFPEVTTQEQLLDIAENGGTAILQQDIQIENTLMVDADMVIDLNGYDLKVDNQSVELEEGDGVIVYGNLTIKGEGTVTANTRAIWARGENATINIMGGHFVGSTLDNANSEVIYASGANTTINIYGGTFEASYTSNGFATPQYALLNLYGNGAKGQKINVYGGSFKNFDPSNNISENPAQDFVAEGYESVKNGDWYVVVEKGTKVAANADELVDALENGDDVTLFQDVKIDPAGMSSGYGTTGINVKNGQTIDGNGNVLDIQGAGGTWDSGICTSGGIIRNITVTGSFRGVFIKKDENHNEKVILENVIIDGTTYTISCDSGTGEGLEAANSVFNGWTSFAATLGNAKFTDCSFGEGNGYAYCRPYAPTEFINCSFEKGYQIDTRAACTFTNCTLDGVPVTAANLATLVTSNIANASVK